LAKLKKRNMIVTLIACSILLSIVLTIVFHVFSNAEIASILEFLEGCDVIRVENSLMKEDGDIVETSTINDRKKIQKLVLVLKKTEYKRRPARGVAATKELIEIYILKKDKAQMYLLRVIGNILEIGRFPKARIHRYKSSDENLLYKVRNALGVSNVEFEKIDPNEQIIEVPISERKVWVGTKKEWESLQKLDN